MWVSADKPPQLVRVYQCIRNFDGGKHCMEWLRWTGFDWITNDDKGYVRNDVAAYWEECPPVDGWEDFRVLRNGELWQRKVFYYCNPELMTECPGTNCRYRTKGGECYTTTDECCALRSPGGLPLVAEVLVRKKSEEVSGDG